MDSVISISKSRHRASRIGCTKKITAFAVSNEHLQKLMSCRKVLESQAPANAVATNGRIVVAQDPAYPKSKLIAADFLLLEHYAANTQLGLSVVSFI